MPLIEKVIKRNGQIADFNKDKIVSAVERAFLEVKSDRMPEEAKSVAEQVVRYLEMGNSDVAPSVEFVQDLVERAAFMMLARLTSFIVLSMRKSVKNGRKSCRQRLRRTACM